MEPMNLFSPIEQFYIMILMPKPDVHFYRSLLPLILICGVLLPSQAIGQEYFSIQNAVTNATVAVNSDRFTIFTDWASSGKTQSDMKWKFTQQDNGYYTIESQSKPGNFLQAVECCGGDTQKIYNWPFNNGIHDLGLWKLEAHPTDPTLVRFLNKQENKYMYQPAAFNSTNPLALDADSPMQDEFGLNSYFRIVPREGAGQQKIYNDQGKETKLEREYRYVVPSFWSQFAVFGIPGSCDGTTSIGGSAEHEIIMNSHNQSLDLSAENFGLAERGDSLKIKIYAIGGDFDNPSLSNTLSFTPTDNSTWPGTINKVPLSFEYITNAAGADLYFTEFPIFVNYGHEDLRLSLNLEGSGRYYVPGPDFTKYFPGKYTIEFPLRASGIVNDIVDSLGYTTDPELPYLVLRDPPGGKSFASIEKGEKICQTISQESTLDRSGSLAQELKIGIAGEAGFIVTSSFEFSTTFSSSGTVGDIQVDKTNEGTCFEATQRISTSQLASSAGAASDVYVTMGYDLKYGIAEVIEYDNSAGCGGFRVDTQMVYTPIPGTTRTRLMSRKSIQTDIENQLAIVADSNNVGPRAAATAQYQVDAWREFLRLDSLAQIEALSTSKVTGIDITAAPGTRFDASHTVQVMEGRSIRTDHYINNSFGIKAKVEVAGSGYSAGFKYSTKKKFGATQSSNSTNTNKIAYVIQDDQGGDKIVADVYNDPIYGTPMFVLDEKSQTSCPYEGGLQRDQPRIEFSDKQGLEGQHRMRILSRQPDTMTVVYPRSADTAVVSITLCNDNPVEQRRYVAQLLSNTNKAGAKVSIGGASISANDGTLQEFPVGAATCDEDYRLEIIKASGVNVYENFKIRFFNDCDTSAARSDFLILSVYFQDNLITANADTVDFGDLDLTVRTTDTRTINVSNTSSIPITIDSIADTGDFLYAFPAGKTIAPGESIPLEITVNSTVDYGPLGVGVVGLGAFEHSLELFFKEINESLSFVIKGRNANGNPVLLPKEALDLGEVEVGLTHVDTLYFVNEGNAPLKLSPFEADLYDRSFSPDRFSFEIIQLPKDAKELTIAPGDTQLVQITFTPTEEKVYSIEVEASLPQNTRSNAVVITGTGVVACNLMAQATADTITCAASTANIQLNTNASAATFSWTGPGNFTSDLQDPMVDQPGSYAVTVQEGACEVVANVEVLEDTTVPDVTSLASDSLSAEITSVQLLTSSSVADLSYEWSGPNNFTSTEASPFVDLVGVYELTVTAPNACQNTITVEVFEAQTTSANTLPLVLNEFQVAPNPVRDLLRLQYRLAESLDLTLRLFDANGRLLMSRRLGREAAGVHRHQLDMSQLPEGVYNLSLQSERGVVNRRVILSK